jgi:hypothetical protein
MGRSVGGGIPVHADVTHHHVMTQNHGLKISAKELA